ncbi:MAG: DUF6391 domain-containing protein [Xenococcaceae cyanobacterium]
MTNPTSALNDNFWDIDFFQPRSTQDSDLLQQVGFIPGLKDLLMLRQVHALEHATVWLLGETELIAPRTADNETIGGLSTEKGFYLYGEIEQLKLNRAVHLALKRIKAGEWDLAIHPRCGTNLSVAMLLTAGLVVSNHLLFPRGILSQMLGLGIAMTAAAQISPDLGTSVQKYLTTSIPFNLEVREIVETKDIWGRSAHFVRVSWRELQ